MSATHASIEDYHEPGLYEIRIKGAVELDALLWSFNNIGIVFIAVFAFGLLRKLDEALAVGYLASRIIDGTIMMVGLDVVPVPTRSTGYLCGWFDRLRPGV